MGEKKPYRWDFGGACMPTEGYNPVVAKQKTFSLGIFQWMPKASGKGLKWSKTVKRIKGDFRSPEQAFSRAIARCKELNTQEGQNGE